MQNNTSYRPHNPGHDYYGEGVYLITLVVGNRDKLLAKLNGDVRHPGVELTPLGLAVQEEWNKTAEIQARKGHKIKIHTQCVMPDHWHGVIEVQKHMDVSLGYIIQLFKASCTSRWRELTGYRESPSTAYKIRHGSRERRRALYSTLPRTHRPLFDDDYDDTICFPRSIDIKEHERHKVAMIHYVNDNPRRAIVMQAHPHFFERRLHIVIQGTDQSGAPITRDYAAFGNIYLLRWARKVQVMCHRKARFGMLSQEEKTARGICYQALPETETCIPYIETQAFQQQHDQVIAQVMTGATVVVTPGISAGEKALKDECLNRGIPLIHLQKEPIGQLWKPERERFDACQRGTLLILSPWHADEMGEVNGIPQESNYSIFHNLNNLAREVCEWSGEAVVKK